MAVSPKVQTMTAIRNRHVLQVLIIRFSETPEADDPRSIRWI